MVVNWSDANIPIGVDPSFDWRPGEPELLGVRRAQGSATVDIVALADGPVLNAIMRPTTTGCNVGFGRVREGKYVWFAMGHDPALDMFQSLHEGALGGSVGQTHPTLLAHFQDDENYGWYPTASSLFRATAWADDIVAFPWSMEYSLPVASVATDPEGLQITNLVPTGSAIFWEAGSLYHQGVNVWDPVNGARALRRWIGDWTRGACDLGTDGVDLVWFEGSGKDPTAQEYPVMDIMTAPFTTDPAALMPRRVRSQPPHLICAYPYVVGCGYAAGGSTFNHTMVTRLSDGVSWTLPNVENDLELNLPIGITCDEVFIRGTIAGQWNIARVRLDSLGPGDPPD
jgi:hypothetical protein